MTKNVLTLATAAGLAALLGAARPAQAQNSAVNNAILSENASQYDKARASIEQATTNDKTKDQAKTWFTRGEIYQRLIELRMSDQAVMKALYTKFAADLQPGQAEERAIESYNKALALDSPTGEYGKQVPDRLKYLNNVALNDGVNAYKAKDFDKAIASYKLASSANPQDTTALLYAAYAAEGKEDLTVAKGFYNQLLGMGYKSVPLYQRLLYIDQQQKDEAGSQQVLQQALAAYPNNKTFMMQDLNAYLNTGNGQEAIDKIKKAIAVDPGNSNLYGVLGSVYEKNKQSDLAVESFKKAIELDPNNFDAQFNLGIYNFNQAATLYTKASKMDIKTYQVKGKPLEVQGKKYFEASVPYFEKALELQPNDRGTLNALQKVYARLNRPADAKRMEDRTQALEKK